MNPIPNASDSTAEVFLEDERLPSLVSWDEQFRRIVNGTYELRGVEVTLQGVLEQRERNVFLASAGDRPPVRLVRVAAAEKIQWNHTVRALKPLETDEMAAYDNLRGVANALTNGQRVTITGPLRQTEAGYELFVRLLHA